MNTKLIQSYTIQLFLWKQTYRIWCFINPNDNINEKSYLLALIHIQDIHNTNNNNNNNNSHKEKIEKLGERERWEREEIVKKQESKREGEGNVTRTSYTANMK